MSNPKLVIFTADQLKPVIAEGAMGFVSRYAWVSRMLNGFATLVTRQPSAYRYFGPFWWPLKALMVEAGEFQGVQPDPDVVAQASFGDAAMDVAAAWSYQEYTIGNMMSGNVFTVDTEDGDTVDFVLVDEEMEALAVRGPASI